MSDNERPADGAGDDAGSGADQPSPWGAPGGQQYPQYPQYPQQYPPYPSGPGFPPPQPHRPSNTTQFWIGFGLGILAFFGSLVVFIGLIQPLDSAGAALIIVVAGLLAIAGFGLAKEQTRWRTIGGIAGYAATTIVLGGACVAILTNLE